MNGSRDEQLSLWDKEVDLRLLKASATEGLESLDALRRAIERLEVFGDPTDFPPGSFEHEEFRLLARRLTRLMAGMLGGPGMVELRFARQLKELRRYLDDGDRRKRLRRAP
ncbi:MAG: hypothetical protein ACREON_14970 [Gemmatimonadaceae bacterium]